MRASARTVVFALWLAANPAWAHEAAAPAESETGLLSAKDREVYRAAFHKADAHRYRHARELARKADNPLPGKVIDWLELTAPGPGGDFAKAADFVERNPDWPGQAWLQRRAELAMPNDLPDARVRAWFASRPPSTAEGAVRYAEALIRTGERERAAGLLRAAWIGRDFTRREERAFRKRFAELLRREDEVARLDRLLWDRRFRPARRQARRLGAGYPALAEARLALARRGPGVDRAIGRVPAELRNDSGLIYERARWRRRRGRYAGVIELLDPPDPAAPRPARWWPLRKWAARQAFVKGDISVAYRIASGHGLEAGAGFAEAEWLAGWIALRFLDQPDTALRHFKHLHDRVTSPISLARSAFWAGEAARAVGEGDATGHRSEEASRWYAAAARHGTAFYGQLAGRRLGQPVSGELPAARPPDGTARAAFDRRELVQVVRILGELGETKLQERFLIRLRFLAESAEDYALVAELAIDQKRPDMAVKTAKAARADGIILRDHLFPSLTLAKGDTPEPALVLAVVRQESGFYAEAVSGAGARGLMQLLPRTARRVAQRIKVRYSRSKLITDPEYNLRLGCAYLSALTERYDGSYVLALAAYNAGPARANRWIKAFGDPRDSDIDPIDWIESIPFDETRNYVQRILEGLVIYRRHLGVEERDPLLTQTALPIRSWADRKAPADLSCCL